MVIRTLLVACSLIAPPAWAAHARVEASVQGASSAPAPGAPSTAAPGAPGAPGLALRAKKALAVPKEGEQVIDEAVVLIENGKIAAIGPARTTPIPAGYEVIDLGERWVMPGLVDLHSHVGGTFDINDAVYLANPGLRVTPAVVPHNPMLEVAVAAGITTILFIPGSATNMGGQGVLLKTGPDHYDDAVLRDPGSLKLAQAGNPEGWTVGIGRSFMNWDTRNVFHRGIAYAKRWQEYEAGRGEKPEKDLEFEVFRPLLAKKVQISTHTQIYQVVMTTLMMVRKELGLEVFIDHGEMAGYKLAGLAQELGVPAILGPREIEIPTRQFIQWTGSNPEAILGIAAEYQKRGHKQIGFNTDAPVVPEEELPLQAAMSVRYGLDNSHLESVRGLTIVPAMTVGVDHRIGSLEPGKDADIVVVTGDPADPRSSVERVWIDGRQVYEAREGERRW
jgi:imidazolonepropionase-like amidohydrolase